MKQNIVTNKSGSIAVESAFVLPILIFLLFSIIEYGMLFYTSSKIESVANEAARLGLTGNTYGAKNREELIEKRVDIVLDRTVINYNKRDLSVNVEALDDYNTPNSTPTPKNNFGESAQFVLYNVSYRWKLLSPLLYPFLADEDGKYKISARVMVKNEEF